MSEKPFVQLPGFDQVAQLSMGGDNYVFSSVDPADFPPQINTGTEGDGSISEFVRGAILEAPDTGDVAELGERRHQGGRLQAVLHFHFEDRADSGSARLGAFGSDHGTGVGVDLVDEVMFVRDEEVSYSEQLSFSSGGDNHIWIVSDHVDNTVSFVLRSGSDVVTETISGSNTDSCALFARVEDGAELRLHEYAYKPLLPR